MLLLEILMWVLRIFQGCLAVIAGISGAWGMMWALEHNAPQVFTPAAFVAAMSVVLVAGLFRTLSD